MLTHPHVRNLAWVIQSPSPFSLDGLLAWSDDSRWFDELLHTLNQDPAPLEQHIAQLHSRALGHYVESLWQFYFSRHPHYTLLAHNVQIIIDKRTLGELDLIVHEHATDRVLHIELSCKFYMNITSRTALAPLNNWYGPNLSDNLHSKYHKTLSQQLPFAHQRQISDYLKQRGISIDASVAIFKGRTFYPHAAQPLNLQQSQQPEQLVEKHPTHPHDQWLTLSTFAQLAQSQYAHNSSRLTLRFSPLKKPQWLAPQWYNQPSSMSSTNDVPLYNNQQLVAYLRDKAARQSIQPDTTYELLDFAPMQVACYAADDTPNEAALASRIECQRLFIVSDCWLHNAQKQWALDAELYRSD